jgi:hypothetical protein
VLLDAPVGELFVDKLTAAMYGALSLSAATFTNFMRCRP